MATLATGTKKRRKIWRARVKLNWTEYFLGVYETKEEAEKVEQEFRNRMGRNDSKDQRSYPYVLVSPTKSK